MQGERPGMIDVLAKDRAGFEFDLGLQRAINFMFAAKAAVPVANNPA
jgi:hypothetical protein